MATRLASEAPTDDVPAPAAVGATRIVRLRTDLVRTGLGLAVLGIGFLLARQGELSAVERDLFRLVNDLPGIVLPAVWLVMQLGNVVAVPVLAAVAALLRRFRAARDLLVSGLLAYFAADLVKSIVGRERPGGLPVGAVLHEGSIGGIGFVSGHSAVAAALATAVAPYLNRRGRRLAWTLAWGVALARVYVGAHLPLDVLGGLALGWAIGSAVHLVFGIPRRTVRPARVEALLTDVGLPGTRVRPAPVRARSSHPFLGVAPDGRLLYVKYLEPDRAERDWLHRLWRLLTVRDVKDDDALAPLGHQAEHEAVAAMTARARGVRVPEVVVATGSDRRALVVQEFVPGRPLDTLTPAEITPELLRAVWEQVALLHAARVAHHDLVAASVLIDREGQPCLVDFGNARTGASADTMADDVAELLASLAVHVDPEPVVDAAASVLGARQVAAALPSLAPLTLAAETRERLHARPERLSALRRAVRDRLGLPDPARPAWPRAGRAAVAAVAAGCAVVLGLLLVESGTAVLDTLEDVGWRWLGGAAVLAGLARVAAAAAVLATVDRRIAVGRVLGIRAVQDSASLLHGRAGRSRAAERFLESAGVLPDDAARAIRRTIAGALTGAAVVAVSALALGLARDGVGTWRAPADALRPALIALGGACLVAAGQVLAGRGLPAREQARPRRRGRWRRLLLSPRWAVQVAWSAVATGLEAAALACAVEAAGGRASVLAVAAGYAALRLIWTAVPLAGLPGAAEAALLVLLVALGVPITDACAAVLLARALTFWFPAAFGALTARRGPTW
ncbi:phosphatase PAP2 family protein [Trujillonella endophytica]|uniref:non-specific serine/threonine protein kinase n=1 Tax=Trujillonella endophytica TaxID=673521 RepID=A0A1H8SYK0_9ACTN|nr:phosphatase PAP2 family protein [Trujillella endophytica]SEO83585.1 undecaprenyl-diphosphatase [Trujillella endophytica]